MIPYTQTLVGPGGNCLQTAIECVLESPQGALPPQEHPVSRYFGPLNQYLAAHGLVYLEVEPFAVSGWHVLLGNSSRGIRHAAVGYNGWLIWDPHPSRAGLSDVIRWGALLPSEVAS